MRRRTFLKLGAAGSVSVTGLLAATRKPFGAALEDFADATGATSDLITITPGHAEFQGLLQGFNRRWSALECRVVYLPITETGAEIALDRVLGAGLGNSFSVNSGGHCYEDFVYNPSIFAVIDLSLLNAIGFDSGTGAYFAQPGAHNWDLYRVLFRRFNKTLPAGSCYSVGLGGHITGGGYGLLSRDFGLVVDWLTGVRVVTACSRSASIRRVTKAGGSSADRDLFWAHTGGGGGNFGIVTGFEFASLPDAPQHAEIIVLAWNWSDILSGGGASFLARIIQYFENFTHDAPNSAFGLLKLNHQSAGQIALIIQNAYNGALGSVTLWSGLKSALAAHGVDRLADTAGPVIGHPCNLPAASRQVQHLRWIEAAQTLNGSGPNQKGKYKSAYMRKDFTADQVATIYDFLTQSRVTPLGAPVDLSQSLLQVDSYGGAINLVAPEATAIPQRSSIFKLQYQTYWQDELDGASDNGDGHLAWIRDFYTAMYESSGGLPDPERDPTGNVDGCYVNYPDVDLNDAGLATALRLYYGVNLPRLQQTKKIWDPRNYFHHAQSIPAG
jgi:hexose oxidase